VPNRGVAVSEFRKSWKAACLATDKPDALFHDFRRTAVRNMVRAGVPRKVAMLISGHKTESVFERYNITAESDLEAVASRLDETGGLLGSGTISGTMAAIAGKRAAEESRK
jgi:integrase